MVRQFLNSALKNKKKECLIELLVFDLRGSKPFEGKPNIGTTEIQDNGKIIRTKDGFIHLVTPNGASSEGVESNKLINAVRRVFF